jgi:hypothetical protein
MTDETNQGDDSRPKKARSPNFPFISLEKAVERAEALYQNHRREPARLIGLAPSWGYSPKSSGLLQSVGALKQFGLLEDSGSGEDRKVWLTDLGVKIVADERPGAKDAAKREAVYSPTLFSEYLPRWHPTRPSDAHCISELSIDRGFTDTAARGFLKVFDESVRFANLSDDEDGTDDGYVDDDGQDVETTGQPQTVTEKVATEAPRHSFAESVSKIAKALELSNRPLRERLQLTFNSDTLAVAATLKTTDEVDQLIGSLKAMQSLLPSKDEVEDGMAG